MTQRAQFKPTNPAVAFVFWIIVVLLLMFM